MQETKRRTAASILIALQLHLCVHHTESDYVLLQIFFFMLKKIHSSVFKE
jgi:hypothetical protein